MRQQIITENEIPVRLRSLLSLPLVFSIFPLSFPFPPCHSERSEESSPLPHTPVIPSEERNLPSPALRKGFFGAARLRMTTGAAGTLCPRHSERGEESSPLPHTPLSFRAKRGILSLPRAPVSSLRFQQTSPSIFVPPYKNKKLFEILSFLAFSIRLSSRGVSHFCIVYFNYILW